MTEASQFARGRPPAQAAEDLSDEISRSVEKLPGDLVRCTLVSNGNYRCNWWAPQAKTGYDNPGMGGLLVTTHRVRQSLFFHVARGAGGLVITPKTRL